MKKRITLMLLIAMCTFGTVWAQTTITQRSLYVSAKGDDSNNGRSEATPYKTLKKAVQAANDGVIKTITVIGTITAERVNQEGTDEILITGKTDAVGEEKAVINSNNPEGSNINNCLYIRGKFSFTNIHLNFIFLASDTTVTLGAGVVVSNPRGYGVRADYRCTLIMTDDAIINGCSWAGFSSESSFGQNTIIMSGNAKITNNKRRGVNCSTLKMSDNTEISGNTSGGVSADNVTMSGNSKIVNNKANAGGGIYSDNVTISGNAVISGNTAEYGGGIFSSGNVTISDNAVISGNTAKNGGGIDTSGSLTQEGGEISGNKAEYGAGVYLGRGTFNHKGGTITGNEAEYVGGGVYVKSGATYTAGSGKVSGNSAGDGGNDMFRQ